MLFTDRSSFEVQFCKKKKNKKKIKQYITILTASLYHETAVKNQKMHQDFSPIASH